MVLQSLDHSLLHMLILILDLFEGGLLSKLGKEVDLEFDKIISSRIKDKDFQGKLNETLMLFTENAPSKLLLIGLGKRNDFNHEKARQVGGSAIKKLQSSGQINAIAEIPGIIELGKVDGTQAFVEGAILGSYQFLDYKTEDKHNKNLKSLQ